MSEDYLAALSRFAIESAHAQTVDDVLWLLTNDIVASLGFEDCVVYLTEHSDFSLRQVAAYGNKSPQHMVVDNPITLAFGQGITGRAALLQRTMLVNDVREDADYVVDDLERLSELAVPILVEGKTVGVIDSEHSHAHFYTLRHQQTLEALASIIAAKYQQDSLVQELKRSEEAAMHAASHDSLTGLANRMQFLAWAEQLLHNRSEHSMYLAMIDLDRFKSVNDRYGHEAGDRLLCAVSKRFNQILPKGTRIARLGGDEFAVLAGSHIASPEEMGQILVASLQEAIDIQVDLVVVGASVGLALLDANIQKVSHWLQRADAMLYQQKALGVSGYRIYPEEQDQSLPVELVIHAELTDLIERNGFDVALQPIVALSTSAVVGFEALIRWNHPVFGIIGPDQFIPIAERLGLIRGLDNCVIESVDRLFERVGPHQYISVNLSAASLSLLDKNETLMKLADRVGDRLCVEVTERSMVANFELAAVGLEGLRAKGVKVFLDDFGTGYSSLSYLHKLPVDTLKIDQSFVQNLSPRTKEESVVRTIIALATSLELGVVAEGVETTEQSQHLMSLGVELAQGYFFGMP